jgi:hypothetical protein
MGSALLNGDKRKVVWKTRLTLLILHSGPHVPAKIPGGTGLSSLYLLTIPPLVLHNEGVRITAFPRFWDRGKDELRNP